MINNKGWLRGGHPFLWLVLIIMIAIDEVEDGWAHQVADGVALGYLLADVR